MFRTESTNNDPTDRDKLEAAATRLIPNARLDSAESDRELALRVIAASGQSVDKSYSPAGTPPAGTPLKDRVDAYVIGFALTGAKHAGTTQRTDAERTGRGISKARQAFLRTQGNLIRTTPDPKSASELQNELDAVEIQDRQLADLRARQGDS